MRRPRWLRRPRTFRQWLAFLGGLIVLSLVVQFIVVAAEGFPSNNHDDSFTVHFQNDLAPPTILALCHSDHSAICNHPYYRDHLSPGEATEENIATDLRTEWAVEDANGKLLRCINLYWKKYPGSTPQVSFSASPRWANPCR